MLTIVITILLFGFLILIHEAGHYLTARLFGVGIKEFSLGMGPKLFSNKGKNNDFTLRLLPIGGYVDMVGEYTQKEGEEVEKFYYPDGKEKAPFNTKPVWQRMIVVLAGPLVNIIAALLAMSVVVMTSSALASTTVARFDDSYTVSGVTTANRNLIYLTEDYGEEAFLDGDVILEIDGVSVNVKNNVKETLAEYGSGTHNVKVMRKNLILNLEKVELPTDSVCKVSGALEVGDEIKEIGGKTIRVATDMSYAIARKGVTPVDVKVIRDGQKTVIEDVIFPLAEDSGIVIAEMGYKVVALDKTVGTVLYQAVFQSWATLSMTVSTTVDALLGKYGVEALSGPIGIGQEIGNAIKGSDPVYSLVIMAIFISLSLGICNLLPIPALDGGRFVLLFVEAIRRKPLNPKIEQISIGISMILLFALMGFVAIKDLMGL